MSAVIWKRLVMTPSATLQNELPFPPLHRFLRSEVMTKSCSLFDNSPAHVGCHVCDEPHFWLNSDWTADRHGPPLTRVKLSQWLQTVDIRLITQEVETDSWWTLDSCSAKSACPVQVVVVRFFWKLCTQVRATTRICGVANFVTPLHYLESFPSIPAVLVTVNK